METRGRIESRIIRAVLGSPPEPPVDLFKLASDMGAAPVRRAHIQAGCTDFSQRQPVIFLNRTETGARMRFILAHEIAHIMLRTPAAQSVLQGTGPPELPGSEEELADRIGATILVPDSLVRALRKVRYTLAGLEHFARRADVSLTILIHRLSSAQINVGLLHWWRGDHSWHVIDRPGVPSCLHGYFELSEAGHRRFENLRNREWMVTIDGHVDGRRMEITGPAYRQGGEVYQLVEEIQRAPERYRAGTGESAFRQVRPPGGYARQYQPSGYRRQESYRSPAHCAD